MFGVPFASKRKYLIATYILGRLILLLTDITTTALESSPVWSIGVYAS